MKEARELIDPKRASPRSGFTRIDYALGFLQCYEPGKALAEALSVIPPDRLRSLSTWVDMNFPDRPKQVQEDLWKMAEASEIALRQWRQVVEEER